MPKHNFYKTLARFWVKVLVFIRFKVWDTDKFWHLKTLVKWSIKEGENLYTPLPENPKEIRIMYAWEYENKLNEKYNLGSYL